MSVIPWYSYNHLLPSCVSYFRDNDGCRLDQRMIEGTKEEVDAQLKDWAEIRRLRREKGIPELGPDKNIYDTEYLRQKGSRKA